MIRLARPSPDVLDHFVTLHTNAPISTAVMASPRRPPPGFCHNQHRGCLGRGAATFSAARAALGEWKQFPGGWIAVHDARRPVHVGQTVAIVARCLGLWSVNCCRVTDARDNSEGDIVGFAITYATVVGHMLEGVEQFCIEWDRSDDRVWYDLSSYSRPRHWLARLLHPVIRRLQRRFAGDSLAALRRAARFGSVPAGHPANFPSVDHVDVDH